MPLPQRKGITKAPEPISRPAPVIHTPPSPPREQKPKQARVSPKNQEMRELLVSIRDFIESHKHAAYFKRRWGPWSSYLERINAILK